MPCRWLNSRCARRCKGLVACILVCAALCSCGTGIEVTERITDKDVAKAAGRAAAGHAAVTLEAYADSLPTWKAGKRFWVTDDQVKQMLAGPAVGLDTMSLAGHMLEYDGLVASDLSLDDSSRVDIRFIDQTTGQTLVYRYGKPVAEARNGTTLPMLIDLDMVAFVARQVAGRDFYIRTRIWYDPATEQMLNGRQFIKVRIDSVLPGNSVLPLRAIFTTADTREQAMVWMSQGNSMMGGRSFDALFASADPHLLHPSITDANWELITQGRVVQGMTKEECRLALGAPLRTSERPDQAGMREYWYYDGGSYLFFVDGLLSQFRR